jgi:hypothetical protein
VGARAWPQRPAVRPTVLQPRHRPRADRRQPLRAHWCKQAYASHRPAHFELVSTEQYRRLCQCARASRTDDYGLIIEGAILAIGEAAIRPGEIFALHHTDLDYAENIINIRRQRDPSTGAIVWPKDDDRRWVIMSPALREHLRAMPRYSDTILFPAIRGGLHGTVNGTYHWHAVRASAGCPAKSSTSSSTERSNG